MSFLPAISSHTRDRTSLRARLYVQIGGKSADRRRLTFFLSRGLIDRIGWQIGERLIVAIGVGADTGAFQVTRSDHARTGSRLLAVPSSAGARFGLSLPPEVHGFRPADFVDRIVQPASLAWGLTEGALVLRADLAPEASLRMPLRTIDGGMGA